MKPSSEALLVSALINNQDTSLGQVFGVSPDDLVGFQAEYRWVLSYQQTYGAAPSRDALLSKFPGFPFTDATDAAFAADEVRYAANQRMLRSAVRTAALAISEGDYDEAYMAIAAVSPAATAKPMTNALHHTAFLDTYHEKVDALSVPWKTLQNLTGGIREGDLWFLAARLGQGKSWSLGAIMAHALLNGRRVAMYSLEMSEAQVLTRMHVVLGKALGVPVDHVAMRDRLFDVIAYRKLVNRIRDEVPGELLIHDATRGKVSPATIAGQAAEVDLAVVDYAGLMASPIGKRAVDDWRVMAAISNELKEVAVSSKTRILTAAQINREGEKEGHKYPPKVKNLAQSDALGQDGDVVLTHKQYSRSSNIYSIEKNRHGAAGLYFFTRFLPNEGAFHEISRDTADDLRDSEGDE